MGRNYKLFLEQHTHKEAKAKRKNISMTGINDKKADDMALQSWKIECFKMYKIFDKVYTSFKIPWKTRGQILKS